MVNVGKNKEYSYIETISGGYKGCSTNGQLFTLKDSNDKEIMMVHNLPIKDEEECLDYQKKFMFALGIIK